MLELSFLLLLSNSGVSLGQSVSSTQILVEQVLLAKIQSQFARSHDERLTSEINMLAPWAASDQREPTAIEFGEAWKKQTAAREKIKKEVEDDEHKKLMRERKARERRDKKRE